MSLGHSLWRAVLAQAVADAYYEGESISGLDGRDLAREWFRFGGRDFRLVCDLAGFDPDAVQHCYLSGRMSLANISGGSLVHSERPGPRHPTVEISHINGGGA